MANDENPPKQLTEQQIAEFREAFDLIDKDNNGRITTEDLLVMMRSLGQNPTGQELKDMVDPLDGDGDGEIDFDEFLTVMASGMKATDTEDELKCAFEALDRNHDGYITGAELKAAMVRLGERLTDEEVQEVIRATDSNGDRLMDFGEFVQMMMRN